MRNFLTDDSSEVPLSAVLRDFPPAIEGVLEGVRPMTLPDTDSFELWLLTGWVALMAGSEAVAAAAVELPRPLGEASSVEDMSSSTPFRLSSERAEDLVRRCELHARWRVSSGFDGGVPQLGDTINRKRIFGSLNRTRAPGPFAEEHGVFRVQLGGLPLPRVRHGSTRTISWTSGGLGAEWSSEYRIGHEIGAEPQVAETRGRGDEFRIFVDYEVRKECTLPGLNVDLPKCKGSGAVRQTSGGESGDLSLRPAWLHLQGNSIPGIGEMTLAVGIRFGRRRAHWTHWTQSRPSRALTLVDDPKEGSPLKHGAAKQGLSNEARNAANVWYK